MKKTTILIVMAVLCLFFKVKAQSAITKIPLKVGDTIPDIVLNNVLNFKSKTIRLADYKDRLLILDFWATYCGPCLEHLPVIYSLQKKLGDKVFFLPVNPSIKTDTREKLIKFFKERKKVFDLPSVIQDSVLYKLFQLQGLGVYVWIKNGVIRQITDGEDVTEPIVLKVANENNIKLRQLAFTENDYSKPLFINGNGTHLPSNYFMRSMLFPYSPNFRGGGFDTDSLGNVTRIYQYNIGIRALLGLAYPEINHFRSRFKIRSKHADMLIENPVTDNELRKSAYCYEALFPPTSRDKALQYVRQDLARFFPFELDSAKIVDTCWVLSLSKDKKVRAEGAGKKGTNIWEGLKLPVYFHGETVADLRYDLESIWNRPVLDETGYSENVWLDLPGDLTKFDDYAKSLAKQGIILSKELRPVEFLIIKDRTDSN
ncbi:TlpA family protein disulfide reductase [Mucilaginibacter sp. RCC_168]|uniref:TlpA family protein disulfide reductase n=1 Tax=Mucilaginibacter sp. RCC_168 TaxID=3239221 RepID=UPI00352662FE